MNRIGVPDSEHKELVAYLKKTYRYEDGGIVNRKTGRRPTDKRMANGYLIMSFAFKGKNYCTTLHRIVWALCYNELPEKTIDHMNGNRLDNRIENLREVTPSENCLNRLRPWKPNPSTGLPGVSKSGDRFAVEVGAKCLFFRNKFEAFHTLTMLGRMFREDEE